MTILWTKRFLYIFAGWDPRLKWIPTFVGKTIEGMC